MKITLHTMSGVLRTMQKIKVNNRMSLNCMNNCMNNPQVLIFTLTPTWTQVQRIHVLLPQDDQKQVKQSSYRKGLGHQELSRLSGPD